MDTGVLQSCARIAAGRSRLVAARLGRNEQVSRLRVYLQQQFGDFVKAVDPVTGTRLVELLAEGSKAKGDLVLAVALFEGSRLRFAVNATGRLDCTSVPPDILAEFGEAVDLDVAEDLSRASIVFQSSDGARRTHDVLELVERLVGGVAAAVERDAGTTLSSAG